ncbi:MAG: DUF5683 domain-containing protein [Candidatus Zixiibacteriota bacterium]
MLKYIVILLTFALAGDAVSQIDSTGTDSTVVADTLIFNDLGQLGHANPVTSPVNFEKKLTQNPTVGLFKSMVVPGWGQLGNRRYFKAILFAGLDGWFIGSAIHYGQQASDFRDKYEAAEDRDLRNDYYDLYSDRKDERNKFTWFAVIVTFISMFDAYADAHLSGYPTKLGDGELSLDLKPLERENFVACLSYRF